MKTITDLDAIRIAGQQLKSPTTEIDLEAGLVRVPLLFLVDVSGSMETALPVINQTLKKLMESLYNAEGAEKFMVDFAIITFGGDGVVVNREYDLLKSGETFKITKCDGMTPLGEAMLYAYYYSAKRKQQYKEIGLSKYNQPTVVLITDFYENKSRSSTINGQTMGGDKLYSEMAELYSEAYSKTLKQYTYSITPNGLNVSTSNRDQLNVDVVNAQGVDIAKVLKIVISEYIPSLSQATNENDYEAIAAATGDSEAVNDILGYSDSKLCRWQKEASRPNPLDEVVIIEC